MATTNDVTGDSLRSKANSQDYRNNFDNIFRKTPVTLGANEKPSKNATVPPKQT